MKRDIYKKEKDLFSHVTEILNGEAGIIKVYPI